MFHQPRQAPTMSWNAALTSRNSLVDLVSLQSAVKNGCFRVPWRLRLWVELGPFLNPFHVGELRGDEDRRHPLVHDDADAPKTHVKSMSGKREKHGRQVMHIEQFLGVTL